MSQPYAMVNTDKEEPDGFGSLADEIVLVGEFFVPKEQKLTGPGQEQLLLHATVEELVRHDLALRENADDGRYLVFPSQFNRDYEDAPEPKGRAVAITFDGPVQSLYPACGSSNRETPQVRNEEVVGPPKGFTCWMKPS
jgi:hypothetical protein